MSKEITTRKTIQELAKSLKKTFAKKTDLDPIRNLATSAIHSVGFAGNKISFYTTAETSGSAAFSVDLPADMVLDQTKTKLVDNFAWNEGEDYPGAENPNLDGKPVLVLAVKGDGETVNYSFLSMEKLIDTYTGAAGDGTTTVTVSGYQISVNVNISPDEGNRLQKKENGLFVPKPDAVDISGKADKDQDATEGNIAVFDGDGNPVDSGKKPADFVAVDPDDAVLHASDISDYTESEIDQLLAAEE